MLLDMFAYKYSMIGKKTHTKKPKHFKLLKYFTKLTFIFSYVDGPDSVNLNSSSQLTVQEGDDVAVSCEANCNPPCSYSWTFKSAINPASRVLTLNNIQRSSAGVYACTAKNTDIQKSSDKKIKVDVQCELNM